MRNAFSLLGLFCFVVGMSRCQLAFGQSKSPVDRQKEIEKMIDAMASRNKAPLIVDGEKVHSSRFDAHVPVVPVDYDWAEQDRVRTAVLAIRSDSTDEIWWDLRQHADDNRYSLTAVFDDSVDAKNIVVGDFCRTLSDAYLTEVYRKLLPDVSGRMPFDFKPEIIVDKNEKQWVGRPLYELQIAVCEEALKQFENIKATQGVAETDYRSAQKSHKFTVEEKAKFAEKIKDQIEYLKRWQQPVLPWYVYLRGIDHHQTAWEPITKDEADAGREDYE
jgi:hypothetical protein